MKGVVGEIPSAISKVRRGSDILIVSQVTVFYSVNEISDVLLHHSDELTGGFHGEECFGGRKENWGLNDVRSSTCRRMMVCFMPHFFI